jgi:serine/threonine protein kinase
MSLEVKLADFGLAKILGPANLTKTGVGSPAYVAPEVLRADSYGYAVDMWSLGVLTYTLLSGYLPFCHEQRKMLFILIIGAKFEFHPQYWSKVSQNAQDFISSLLVENPDERMSAVMALEHEWLSGSDTTPHAERERSRGRASNFVDSVGETNKGHNFLQTTYFSPTWCSYCHDFLWGMRKQGYQCSDCRRNLHKKCLAHKGGLICKLRTVSEAELEDRD